jgi:hypothetical protein
MAQEPERWRLVHEGHEHVVEIADAGLRRAVTWRVDGTEVGDRRTTDKRVVISGGERGAVRVQLPEFVGPARRVTWYSTDGALDAEAAARTGLGGLDLVPDPGSKAAAREAWIREHPRLYVARRVATAVLSALVPLLVLWLLSQVRIPWPSISIPWPDWRLPSIPLPDLPDLPDLPELPAWLRALLDRLEYVWPVVLALGLGYSEVKRRRQQDERRRRAARTEGSDADPEATRRP